MTHMHYLVPCGVDRCLISPMWLEEVKGDDDGDDGAENEWLLCCVGIERGRRACRGHIPQCVWNGGWEEKAGRGDGQICAAGASLPCDDRHGSSHVRQSQVLDILLGS